MSKHFYLISFLISLLLPFSTLYAQKIKGELDFSNPNQTHIVTTTRGDVLFGRVTTIVDNILTFQFKNAPLYFNLKDLISIEVIENEAEMLAYSNRLVRIEKTTNLPIRPDMSGHEQLLLGSTAFNFKKKQGEYRSTQILWNMVDYGFSDNFSAGAGVAIPLIVQLRAKYTKTLAPKIHVGVGTNMFFATINDTDGAPVYNYSYGALSVGTPERFISGSFGYFTPFSNEDIENTTVFTFGGSIRINDHWRLFLDSVILPDINFNDPHFFPSINASWFDQRNRLDFGLMTVLISSLTFDNQRDNNLIPIPVFNYARRF